MSNKLSKVSLVVHTFDVCFLLSALDVEVEHNCGVSERQPNGSHNFEYHRFITPNIIEPNGLYCSSPTEALQSPSEPPVKFLSRHAGRLRSTALRSRPGPGPAPPWIPPMPRCSPARGLPHQNPLPVHAGTLSALGTFVSHPHSSTHHDAL